MKVVVAHFPDNVSLNLSELFEYAKYVRFEEVPDKEAEATRVVSFGANGVKKALPNPDKPKRKYNKGSKGQSSKDAIMAHFARNKKFTNKEAKAWVVAAGLSPNSASPMLVDLQKAGCVKRTGYGEYTFLRSAQALLTGGK